MDIGNQNKVIINVTLLNLYWIAPLVLSKTAEKAKLESPIATKALPTGRPPGRVISMKAMPEASPVNIAALMNKQINANNVSGEFILDSQSLIFSWI